MFTLRLQMAVIIFLIYNDTFGLLMIYSYLVIFFDNVCYTSNDELYLFIYFLSISFFFLFNGDQVYNRSMLIFLALDDR